MATKQRTISIGNGANEMARMVRVLVEDPGLGRFIPTVAFAAAAAAAIAPLVCADVGQVSFLLDEADTHIHLGVLVLSGVLARHLAFGQLGASELLGPGDIIRPWPRQSGRSSDFDIQWEVLAPVRLAVLDEGFVRRIAPWPEVHSALWDRGGERADAHALQAALRQTSRIEDRVLVALWHFAVRWGEVDAEGRRLDLSNVTGEVLGRIVGARRQSVSTALGKLADSGAIKRLPGRQVVIPSEPAQLQRIAPGRRSTDRPSRIADRGEDAAA
jgi:hypothetical protein